MPVRFNFGTQSRPFWIVIGVVCVCIVTSVGFVRAGRDSKSEHDGTLRKASVSMGHRSTSQHLPGVSSDSVDVKSFRETLERGSETSLEEQVLANSVEYPHLDNPHPHISMPQLPFCKPTKTTLRGGVKKGNNKEREKRSSELENVNSDEIEEDEEVEEINAADDVLEADRKFVIATLDGRVTLLNKTGHPLWTVKTGGLFSATISKLQLKENGKDINLIPSLTGGVYKYDGDSLYPMPFNADSLLKKSFMLSSDVVITGGKELRTFGIDVKTGNIRYECGISGCVMPSHTEVNAGNDSQDSVVLVVKKQLQTVRAIGSSNGEERWNFSVGTHELALAGVTEGCYHGEQRHYPGKGFDYLKVVIPEGRVFGADREHRIVWDQVFESPISQAWILEGGQLISVDPITNTPLTDVPSLYIGVHNQQLYVQESQAIAEKMDKYFGLDDASELKRKPLKIAWKSPGAITGVSGSTSTALSTVSHSTWVSFAIKDDFRPFFIYEKDSVGDALEGPNNTDVDEDSDEDSDEDEEAGINFSDGITQVIVMSLWFWWKEVLGISLLTAVLLNLILMKPLMRAVRSQTIREMSGYFQQLWNRWKEEEESRALLSRHSSNLLSLPAPESDECVAEESRKRSTSSSSTGSLHSPYAEDRDIPFYSQYLSEFVPIQCLGRGGFGVVFEAKKTIDDRTYAVKRITLPDREKARVRVMREVKALAQVDHKNIVRYFNAWIESPPQGWLEKNDPLWAKTLIGSTSPTMDYPSDMLASSMLSQSRGMKPDHSKISVPNTPNEPNEDSYIVFESRTTDTYSKVSFTGTSPLLINSNLEEVDTSINMPPSEGNSTESSVSGGGFFARRPTSLGLPSSISSFHEEISTRRSVVIHEFSEDKSVKGKESDTDEPKVYNVMYLYIQQELCQKHTLQDWLKSEKNRDLCLVVNLFSQIVEAVEYVHAKKLIHRDLKPSNIFLAEVTENGLGVLTVKIGDFGLATTAYAEIESEKATPMDAKGQTVRINLTGQVGTHLYMSPEQYQRKPYDYKVDIYSLGLIFFELLVPFSTDMERYNTLSGVRKLNFSEQFKDCFPEEYDLIRTMISHNPNERPDATKINAWVKKHIQSVTGARTLVGSRGSPDGFVGRSVSSPADIAGDGEISSLSSTKVKARFQKTHSVM